MEVIKNKSTKGEKKVKKPAVISELEKCLICGLFLKSRYEIRSHKKQCGKTESVRANIACLHPSCFLKFSRQLRMLKHLEEDHKVHVDIQNLVFNHFQEFLSWKEREEACRYAYFSKQRGTQTIKNGNKYHCFICQRDGSDRPHRKKGEPSRLTSKKHKKGQIKVSAVCPARMIVTETTESVVVIYVSSHNHTLAFEDTKHHPLPKSTLEYVKDRLSVGIAPEQVQLELQSDAGSRESRNDPSLNKKEYFVTLKNLKEIQRRLVKTVNSISDDYASVTETVNKLKQERYNPVLVFKQPGMSFSVSPNNINPELMVDQDLFAIGLQTQEQLNIMETGSKKILVIDVIEKVNHFDFYTVNLIVPDEFGHGYPVAHFIASRLDEIALLTFYASIKERSPDLMLKYVICENEICDWSILAKVFEDVTVLNGKRQTQRIFMNKLKETVKSENKRQDMYNKLLSILEGKDKCSFKFRCDSFRREFASSESEFNTFFETQLLTNVEKWAFCYRPDHAEQLDPTNYCDKFQSKLNFFYNVDSGESSQNTLVNCKRIDDLINLLLKIEGDMFLEHRGKILYNSPETTAGKNIYLERHKIGLAIPDTFVWQFTDAHWKVRKEDENTVPYDILLLRDVCSEELCFEKCLDSSCLGLCSHLYTCSCGDGSELCGHIHKVHGTRLVQNRTNGVHHRGLTTIETAAEGFQLFDEPLLPVVGKLEGEMLLAKARDHVKRLADYLENRIVQNQMLPHICETLDNLISQCRLATGSMAGPSVLN